MRNLQLNNKAPKPKRFKPASTPLEKPVTLVCDSKTKIEVKTEESKRFWLEKYPGAKIIE